MHITQLQYLQHFINTASSRDLSSKFPVGYIAFVSDFRIIPTANLPHHPLQVFVVEMKIAVFPGHHFFHIYINIYPHRAGRIELGLLPWFPKGHAILVHRGSHDGAFYQLRNEPAVKQAVYRFLATGDTTGLPVEVSLPTPEFEVPPFAPPEAAATPPARSP